MLKLYRRADGVLYYHEAWCDDRALYEHGGIICEHGQIKVRSLLTDRNQQVGGFLFSHLVLGTEQRLTEVRTQAMLVVEYVVDGFGKCKNWVRQDAITEHIKNLLIKLNMGMCECSELSSISLSVRCLVADFDAAKLAIKDGLAGTEFSNYTRIYEDKEQ